MLDVCLLLYILTVQHLFQDLCAVYQVGILISRILYENAGNTGVCTMFNFSFEIRVLIPYVGVIFLLRDNNRSV